MKENDSIDLIHKIREKNYKKTKDMTNQEYIKHIRDGAFKFDNTLKSSVASPKIKDFIKKLATKKSRKARLG